MTAQPAPKAGPHLHTNYRQLAKHHAKEAAAMIDIAEEARLDGRNDETAYFIASVHAQVSLAFSAVAPPHRTRLTHNPDAPR